MRIHFIAIGGSAMHNLAIALNDAGYEITGSDDEIFEPSRGRLAARGLLPETMGWDPSRIDKSLDVIILGMHAKPDNPELLYALEKGVPVMSYPEFLAKHAANKKRVVIGGSHGKTTITAMVMHVLKSSGVDFDYMVGSKVKNFDVMVRLSEQAPVMIFEGDEYLSSPIDRRPKFHWYKPHLALLTGVAWDHVNVFPTFENYVEQFDIFVDSLDPNGRLVWFGPDPQLQQIVEKHHDKSCLAYDLHPHHITDGITILDTPAGPVPISLFGRHNLSNLEGARLICHELGIKDADFYSAIRTFEGASNRLEKIWADDKLIYFKDFAHAPSKAVATQLAVSEQFPHHRKIICFELHTYSSLSQAFLSEYKGAMDAGDDVAVYFNPHAIALKRLAMLNKEEVRKAFGREDLAVFDSRPELEAFVIDHYKAPSVVLMMSSGNFDGIDHPALAKRLLS